MEIDRRIQLRPRQLGVEQRLLDPRGAHAQVGVVRDGFGDSGGKLIVAERHQPVVDSCAGAGARGGPLRGHLHRGQRLLFHGCRIRRRLQRTTRHDHGQQSGCERSSNYPKPAPGTQTMKSHHACLSGD